MTAVLICRLHLVIMHCAGRVRPGGAEPERSDLPGLCRDAAVSIPMGSVKNTLSSIAYGIFELFDKANDIFLCFAN